MENNINAISLGGYKTQLRALNKATDLENCLKWMNDPVVTQFLLVNPPLSRQEEEMWFDNLPSRKNDIHLAIETKEGVHIGNIGIHNIDWRMQTATTGTVIGEQEYWSGGYGTDAKMILMRYAFEVLGLRKLNSAAIAYNERSVNYSMRCGYKIEGTLRAELFKNGKYHDKVVLGVFREEWQGAYKAYCEKMGAN